MRYCCFQLFCLNFADFLSKFIKRALRKSSSPSEEEEGTDNEQQDSLPEDINIREAKCKPEKPNNFRHAINSVLQQKENVKPDITRRSDSNETKHVKIQGIKPAQTHSTTQNKTIYERRISNDKPPHTSGDTSRNTRQDSQASNWSENIPVITISKTESEECILEKQKQTHKPDVVTKADVEPSKESDKHRKHVLKKQKTMESEEYEEKPLKENKKKLEHENKSSTNGSSSMQNSDAKTESSLEYKDDYDY